MRKVILGLNVSLDGFIEGPNGEMDWFPIDEELWEDTNAILSTADTALLGRVTYQIFEHYWPPAATNPSSSKDEINFSRWIDKAPKIVFSRTLEKVEWKNSRIVRRNIAEEIAKLKQQPGKNLMLFGGGGIAQTFMQLGLVDDYRLRMNPVVLGGGKPLFKGLQDRMDLKLMETKRFSSGVVELCYQPVKKG